MDHHVIGVVADNNNHHHHHHHMKRVGGERKISKKRRERASVKVVYISSPMKVKTSVSKFRSLVQELTGRESDVARYMEINGGTTTTDHHVHHHVAANNNNNKVVVDPTLSSSSPTSSDSIFEPLDYDHHDQDVFIQQVLDDSFSGGGGMMFPSGFLYESSQADFLRSF